MSAPRDLAVVVPIKSFRTAKGRLAEVLSVDARAALARRCAETVLRAAQPLAVFVVCDDDEVATWATDHGARTVTPPETGLNQAVNAGRTAVAKAGFARLLVVHSDLPNAGPLAPLGDAPDTVTLVPDRHDDGTNALLVPVDSPFVFRYGPGSFAAHHAEAVAQGLVLRVVRRDDLALDLDTADDLRDAGINVRDAGITIPPQK